MTTVNTSEFLPEHDLVHGDSCDEVLAAEPCETVTKVTVQSGNSSDAHVTNDGVNTASVGSANVHCCDDMGHFNFYICL